MKKIAQLVFLVGFISSCAGLTEKLMKEPEVKVVSVGVNKVSAEDVTLDLTLNVVNPNVLDISIGKVDYSLIFSDENVTSGSLTEKTVIPSNGQNDVTIPLTFKYKSVKNIVGSFLKGSIKNQYVLSGTVAVGPFSIPFKQEGEVDLLDTYMKKK